jgi:hypothetical protein
MSLGDFPLSAPIDCWLTTRFAGVPTPLVGGAVAIYKGTSTTQSTAGVTLTVDFDGMTGEHQIHIDPTADPTFYSAGASFAIKITAGTVGGASAVSTVETFTIGQAVTATQNADALLKRDMSAVSGEADRSPLNALRFLRNKWSIASNTLTVTKENDSTTAWTATTTQTAGDPTTGVDPT